MEPTQTPGEKDLKEEPKPLNIVEEAKLIRDEILKHKEDIIEERVKLERIQSEQILSGNTGGKVEPVAPIEVPDDDYANKFMKGEVDPLTEDGISIN